MSPMAVLANGSFLNPLTTKPKCHNRRQMKHRSCFTLCHKMNTDQNKHGLLHCSLKSLTFRTRSFKQEDAENFEASRSEVSERQDRVGDEMALDRKSRNVEISFLAKVAIVLGMAITLTLLSAGGKQPGIGSLFGFQILSEGASPSPVTAMPIGFTFKAFGYRIILPEFAPGWLYFWLLMAAGCGLFISEEALNIWVGISLSRMLTLDGTWQSFVESFSRNAAYITSTVVWVYWGVCISDLIPYYLGRLFKQSGATDDMCSRVGIGKEKAIQLTNVVQKYGNLIGFVERFSLGVRNPTAFLAGTLGISPENFFAGVCCGGLITLPLQLGTGFLLRERPMFALATVATVVGIWTIFPYALAALTAFFLYLRRRYSS